MQSQVMRSRRKSAACTCPPGQCTCLTRKRKIRVRVITGFLGAGKTTMLNHLMEFSDEQPDLLIREYGEAAIDPSLIRGIPEERIHVFFGISMHDHPQLLLHDYLHRLASEDTAERMTSLVMETSGLDHPHDVVQLFMIGQIPSAYELDCVITVVDGQFGGLNLDEYPVAAEQIACADVLVINKADLADGQALRELTDRVRHINAMAKVIVTDHGRVSEKELCVGGTYRQLAQLQAETGENGMDGIKTIVLNEGRALDKEKVNRWIDGVFGEYGNDILRGKGFFQFAGDEWRYEFQSVRSSFHSSAFEKWRYGEPRKSTLVLIGKETLDESSLRSGLSACVADNI